MEKKSTVAELERDVRALKSALDNMEREKSKYEDYLSQNRKIIDKLQSKIAGYSRKVSTIQYQISQMKTKLPSAKEILDTDAPRCGHTWNSLELETLKESLQDFILDMAKKRGRSTLAIKYKIALYCSQFIPSLKWIRLKQEAGDADSTLC